MPQLNRSNPIHKSLLVVVKLATPFAIIGWVCEWISGSTNSHLYANNIA